MSRMGYLRGTLPAVLAIVSVSAGFATGYLDGDAVIELVYASRSTGSVRLLHGVGDGAFEASEILPTDPDPIVVAAGDVDGDGSHDLISGNSFPNTVVLKTNGPCAPLLVWTVRTAAGGSE